MQDTLTKPDYPSYNNVQLFTIHHKLLKYTKCQGCKDLLLISELSIKVDGALRIPLGTKKAAELTMYFWTKRECLKKPPMWTNINFSGEIAWADDVTNTKIDNFSKWFMNMIFLRRLLFFFILLNFYTFIVLFD